MKIELKNIKVAEALSEETTAFTADLYINGIKVGCCKNQGHGGPTMYYPYDSSDSWRLIKEAEVFCEKLPDMPVAFGDTITNIKMNLENKIDDLLDQFLNNKEKQRFQRQMERDMKKSILIGNDQKYTAYNLSKPLHEIIRFHHTPAVFLNSVIQNLIAGHKIKAGDRILNTNFPEGVIIPEPINT